ncbi:nucleotidyl transferase AbiEii/AbiGii toxin family protein [Candidatus Wolfebacteria bacterium]|nr:nucleotidyl transferase AbiEii/AbiGii toxin family protein [Candidatus Wolfebacteria bacterium]
MLKSDNLFFDVLPKATAKSFMRCSEIDFFSRDAWYLAGGTALVLQEGHRRSVDLDFFIKKKLFNQKKAEEIMSEHGEWVTSSIVDGTLYGEFFGAKMSFIAYHFFTSAEPMRKYGTVSILALLDIAVMKIIAISQRGRKRDFFDLYWICQNARPLYDILLRVHKQYSVSQNIVHILKAMVYFDDAESDPEPEIYFNANWKKVKNFFRKEIPIIANKIIR